MHQVLRLRSVGKRERDFDLERDEPAVGADSGVIRVHVDNFGSFHDYHGGRCERGARVGRGCARARREGAGLPRSFSNKNAFVV
jgi:adenosylcobinamide amidohydrolase